ncbi:MAG TPA: hypothetical protein PLM07_02380 [Candidatus Rifleibacterium sp.]|nr:hypothetical protein [Candidatus Rifleibacterium sp.]HPT44729.1 hypothetical protein [Candidatus Rifleibacterium sp.]
MKKLFIALFVLVSLMATVNLSAQPTPDATVADQNNAGSLKGQAVNVDQVLARIETHRAKILENVKARFEKLNEKLAKFEERVNKASARIEKRQQQDGNAKVSENGSEKPAMGVADLTERKARITERYNNFKKNIENRRANIGKRMEENQGKAGKRLEKLSEADRERVQAARDKMQAEVKAEVSKLADEALKKLEATYQKLMAL